MSQGKKKSNKDISKGGYSQAGKQKLLKNIHFFFNIRLWPKDMGDFWCARY